VEKTKISYYNFLRKERIAMIPNDPVILLGFINLKLRDYYDSLDELCNEMDISKEELVVKLSTINYFYNQENNQFV
jgi:hypothetical protein